MSHKYISITQTDNPDKQTILANILQTITQKHFYRQLLQDLSYRPIDSILLSAIPSMSICLKSKIHKKWVIEKNVRNLKVVNPSFL